MTREFMQAVKERRTFYGIGKEIKVGEERISSLIEEAVKHTPSSFNSQSARVVVLFGAQHDALWNLTKDALRKVIPADSFAATEAKIDSFAAGYGTVLYFEDMSVIEGLQNKFPLYSENFPIWSLQSSGMLQHVIWTALEGEGLGASLQHYNPLIDNAVKERWDIPAEWKLLAEMPFGQPTAQPGEKEFQPLETRLRVYR